MLLHLFIKQIVCSYSLERGEQWQQNCKQIRGPFERLSFTALTARIYKYLGHIRIVEEKNVF